mmetsp:Transcript_22436/g.30361  ORF Transcript_22436/g.30361 Transcript_22436/m.30361 type:complete len:233 (-) Transcript_22436:95-793(-)
MPREDNGAGNIWMRRLLFIIPLVGILGVVFYNGYFWYRYVHTEEFFDSMVEGTCELISADYKVPLLMPKIYYYYPLLGTLGMPHSSWTTVPCKTNLTVFDAHGSELRGSEALTLTYFTYWQGFVVDVILDTCSRLVPKQEKAGRFACSFALDARGTVAQGVYVGSKEELPKYPALFLMKAAGMSFCTLGPIALLLCCCAKGALKRHRQAEAREQPAEHADLKGVAEPLLAGA